MKISAKIKVSPQIEKIEYTIVLGKMIISSLKEFIVTKYRAHQIVIITDENVFKYQYEKLSKALNIKDTHLIVIPSGEASKSREVKHQIEDELLSKKLSRKTLILAFGGGVVGDLSGYIAATYKRGIPVIQIPTSLLSMLDSSVGGKTAINTTFGKNMIGAFWQPSSVFADIEMLETLPQDEYINGFVEGLKVSLILDLPFFEFIESNIESIISRKSEVVIQYIQRAIELKRNIIDLDPTESGMRQILNFGHTVGHAIESLSEYRIKHGFAVSIGMAVELKLSQLEGLISEAEYHRVLRLMKKAKMPCNVPLDFSINQMINSMMLDKKAEDSEINFVLLKALGKYHNVDNKYSFSVSREAIEHSINFCKKIM